jgi:hypothetical protein
MYGQIGPLKVAGYVSATGPQLEKAEVITGAGLSGYTWVNGFREVTTTGKTKAAQWTAPARKQARLASWSHRKAYHLPSLFSIGRLSKLWRAWNA